jgi:hypothetical protein
MKFSVIHHWENFFMMVSNGKFNIHNLNCQGNSLTYHCLSDQLDVFICIWGKDSLDKVYNEIFNTLVAKSTFSHVVKFTPVQTERCGCWSNGCSHPTSFHFNDELNFSLNRGSNEAPFYFCEINKEVFLLEMDKVVPVPLGRAPIFFSERDRDQKRLVPLMSMSWVNSLITVQET